ncbi:MAG TPA: hypothetical protein VH393_00160 [Ktedonobacterales bacterium]|jgi:hypothetical protein
MSRRFLALVALVGAIAVLTSGCTAIIIGGPTVPTRTPTLAPTPGPGTPTVAPTTGPGTPSPTPSGPTPTPATGPKGSAKLTKAPTGQANLTYDPNTQNLSIQTTLTTLAPNSPHMMNIRTGNCISTGPIIVTLPNVTADAMGNVNTSSSQMVQPATQPSSGWYIEVTNGIGSSSYDTLNLVCANITSVQGGAGQPQTSNVQFTQGVGPSMNASGNATFTLANSQLTVALTVSGLEPGSQHAAFVNQGTCQNQSAQSALSKGLTPLTGDNSGNASSTTVISPVQSAPSTAWYVVVTRGTTLSSFIDAAPIACGNVVVTQ